jgi:very-short-patch-repair endonuclease
MILSGMDERLSAVAAGLGGVFGSRDLACLGIAPAVTAGLVRRGEVKRIRRGAFVVSSALESVPVPATAGRAAYDRPLWPEEVHRLHTRAILRSRPATDAASHHASVALHGVDVYGCDLSMVDLASDVRRVGRERGLRLHPGRGLPIGVLGGVRVVKLPTALAQVARSSGVVAGVCSMDDAVHDGLCTPAQIAAAIEKLPARRHDPARTALALVDALAESVGETRTRLILRDLGFSVVSQRRVKAGSRVVARVDFLVEGLVVVEFDGLVKYEGIQGRAALAAEKARESQLVDLGFEVVRVVWSELGDPAELARRVRKALKRARERAAARAA